MIAFAPLMSSQEVKDLAEAVVDSLEFAADGGRLSGKLSLSDLPRLFDVLASREGELDCELSGARIAGADGRVQSVLDLKITGCVRLSCQRCLAEVRFDCAIDTRLLLVPEGAEWPEDEMTSDDYDALPANKALSVRELVEEEVLLALPIAPRHAGCLPLGRGERGNGPSPFAALAQWRKR